jgi:hypothetical protein
MQRYINVFAMMMLMFFWMPIVVGFVIVLTDKHDIDNSSDIPDLG